MIMRHIPILFSLTLLAGTAAAATPAAAPATTLAPQPRQVLIARTAVGVMQARHYPDEALDAKLAHTVLEQYFDALDPGHYYFTQTDINRFHKYDDELADDLKHGNLKPAFAIYRDYIEQVRQRIRFALDLLEKEPALNGNESFRFARRHAPWAKDKAALDTLWRERVDNDILNLLLTGKGWNDAKKVLAARYGYALNHVNQTTSNDVFDVFMNAYTQAQDPHSSYFSPFDAQQFQIQMSLQLEGIGAQLGEPDNYVTVVRILPGGPAAKSKALKSGDRIVAVGEGKTGKMTDVVGWRLDDVVKMIRGPKETTVRLRILPAGVLPGGTEKTLVLVRNTIELNAERASAKTMLVKRGGIAYRIGIITIPSFYVNFAAESDGDKHYTSVTHDVRTLIEALKKEKISGILLDLRDDGGGSLGEATALTGLFIPDGPVVQVQERGGHKQVLATPGGEKTVWDGPLAALVNRFSASATEIFAGALKDYHRALILGSRTWGKGTVQQLIELGNFLPGFKAGELKLTTAQFFRVNGSSTQHRGIAPDIAIPSPVDDAKLGESSLPNALPWQQISAADYSPVDDGLATLLPKIAKYYDTVVKTQPRFKLYLDEVDESRAQDALTSLSLNLAARKAERSQRRKHELELDNAWRKLDGKPPFGSLKEADAANFSPPDVPLKAGADVFGEYIALSPPVVAKFTTVVLPATGGQVEWCVNWNLENLTSCDKKRADGPKKRPSPAPNPASGG